MRKHPAKGETWYSFTDDWPLIEASFSQQYGIRLRKARDMSFSEFKSLLTGLLPDTPLGRIISIRSEKDNKVIHNFTAEQKRIRTDWLRKQIAEKMKDESYYDNVMDKMEKAFERMFS